MAAKTNSELTYTRCLKDFFIKTNSELTYTRFLKDFFIKTSSELTHTKNKLRAYIYKVSYGFLCKVVLFRGWRQTRAYMYKIS